MLSAKLGENPSQVGSEILAKLDKRKCQPWVTMAEHGRCDLMIAVDTEKKYIYIAIILVKILQFISRTSRLQQLFESKINGSFRCKVPLQKYKSKVRLRRKPNLDGGFKNFFYVHPYLGKMVQFE